MRIYFSTFFLFLISLTYSQIINDSFDEGFYDAYKSTLEDNNLGAYASYGDKTKCLNQKMYKSQPNGDDINHKLYNDGYRCGVQQATKDIPEILKLISNDHNNKRKDNSKESDVTERFKEINRKHVEKNKITIEQQRVNDNIAERKTNLRDYELQRKRSENEALYRKRQIELNNKLEESFNYLTDDMQSLGNSLMQMQRQSAIAGLNDRINKEKRYIESNINQGTKFINFYNNLPPEVFNKNISGLFEAGLFQPQEYSFSKGKSIQTFTPCLVEVEDNKVLNVYLYSKRGFGENFNINNFQGLEFENGVISISDYETLQNNTLILIEPYITNSGRNHKVEEGGTGKVIVWSKNKKDENKEVFIQERIYDSKNKKFGGDIIREVKTKIIYAKNEEDINLDLVSPVIVNTENMIMVIGAEVRFIPQIGELTLFPKVKSSSTKPLKENEIRYIQIKKYR